MITLDMRKFYGIGTILMVIAFFGNLWNLTTIWSGITIGSRIAQIFGSLLFNLLLAVVFYSMWKTMPVTTEGVTKISSPDLDALINKYQSGAEDEDGELLTK